MEKSIHRQEYKKLMEALTVARKEAGLKQSDMAKKLKWRQQDISKYETCIRRLDVLEFIEICNILSIDYKKLLNKVTLK